MADILPHLYALGLGVGLISIVLFICMVSIYLVDKFPVICGVLATVFIAWLLGALIIYA